MIYNLQLLRAFAAINVVYLHVLLGSQSYDKPTSIFPYIGSWGANGVDIFFVISGFVMIYTQTVNPKTIFNFYKSRILRIVPIYWLITSFIIIVYFFFPGFFKSFTIDIKSSVSSFLFISQFLNNSFPIINLGWTLEWEMLFYLIFGIALYFKTLNRIVSSIFFIMIILFLITKKLFFFEFFLGVIIGYYYNKFNKVDINLALILLIIGIVTLLASINPNSRMLNFDRFFIWGLPSALIVFGAIYCKQIKNKFLLYLGDASYSIYLVQILAIPGFYKLITYLDVKINYNFLSIICLISSVVFGCIFHTYIEKKIRLVKKR